MKKYFVSDGIDEYEVTELDEEIPEDIEANVETKDTDVFTEEEINTLKSLIAAAPWLLEMIAAEPTADTDEEEDGFEDTDEDEVKDEDEEMIVETEKPTRDSKKSFGAIQKKKTNVDDSLEDDISRAWAKRYGGI